MKACWQAARRAGDEWETKPHWLGNVRTYQRLADDADRARYTAIRHYLTSRKRR
jgi:hypothetical protein